MILFCCFSVLIWVLFCCCCCFVSFFYFLLLCRKHKKGKLTQVPYVIDLSLGEFLLKAHKEASGLAFMT